MSSLHPPILSGRRLNVQPQGQTERTEVSQRAPWGLLCSSLQILSGDSTATSPPNLDYRHSKRSQGKSLHVQTQSSVQERRGVAPEAVFKGWGKADQDPKTGPGPRERSERDKK